jgi:hypothetical protein
MCSSLRLCGISNQDSHMPRKLQRRLGRDHPPHHRTRLGHREVSGQTRHASPVLHLSACVLSAARHQGVSKSWSRIVLAASPARVAIVRTSSMSSADGPGVSLSGYSKELRARLILPKDRNAGTEAPNCAAIASWTAMWPPLLVALSPWTASRLAPRTAVQPAASTAAAAEVAARELA